MIKKEKNMNNFKKMFDICCELLNLKYILIYVLFFTIELISKDLNLVETHKFFSFSFTILSFYYLGVLLCWFIGFIGYQLCKHDLDKVSNIEKLIDEEIDKPSVSYDNSQLRESHKKIEDAIDEFVDSLDSDE